MREDALKIDWSETIKCCNIEDDWVAFEKVIVNIRDRYIHKNSYKVLLKAKWVTTEITKCHR